MRFSVILLCANLVAGLGVWWATNSEANSALTSTRLLPALIELRVAAATHKPETIRAAVSELKKNDSKNEIDPQLYQKVDTLFGNKTPQIAESVEMIQAMCRTECTRLADRQAQVMSHGQRQASLAMFGWAAWAFLNVGGCGVVVFGQRREQAEKARMTEELLKKQNALDEARSNNRDNIQTVIQKNREARRLSEELVQERQESGIDGMTGALTKKAGMLKLYRTLNLHAGRNPVCLAMADIDFFKKVNDTYGHPGGDVVIKKFAELMRANTRTDSDDFVIRYGGEEFIMVFPNVQYEEVNKVLNRLQQQVRSTRIYVRDLNGDEQLVASTIATESSITFSCGFAEFSESALYEETVQAIRLRNQQSLDESDDKSWSAINNLAEDIKALADKRLYQAKQGGRNQICGPEANVVSLIETRFGKTKSISAPLSETNLRQAG